MSNVSVIVDTSALVSLSYEDDINYLQALKISKELLQLSQTIIIPSEVFTELINVIGRKRSHIEAITLAESIIASPEYLFAETSKDIRFEALKIFRRQTESVSFTDCIVMAVAQEYSTKVIFGFDNVFSKNGYVLPC